MKPFMISAASSFGRGRRLCRVAFQPFRYVVVKKLLRPDHSRERLALNKAGVRISDVFLQFGIEGVGFGDALCKNILEVRKCVGWEWCPHRAVLHVRLPLG